MNKAISQSITLLIIVGIVVAVSIGVSGWFLGIWTNFAKISALEILSNRSSLYANGSFKIVVINKGDSVIKIIRINIDSWSTVLSSGTITITASSFNVTSNIIAIKPGSEITLAGKTGVSFEENQQVKVELITEDGNVIIGSLVVSK